MNYNKIDTVIIVFLPTIVTAFGMTAVSFYNIHNRDMSRKIL